MRRRKPLTLIYGYTVLLSFSWWLTTVLCMAYSSCEYTEASHRASSPDKCSSHWVAQQPHCRSIPPNCPLLPAAWKLSAASCPLLPAKSYPLYCCRLTLHYSRNSQYSPNVNFVVQLQDGTVVSWTPVNINNTLSVLSYSSIQTKQIIRVLNLGCLHPVACIRSGWGVSICVTLFQ
jgi:hypothetical protein